MEISQFLGPAIYYEDNGYPVTGLITSGWFGFTKKLADMPNLKQAWTIDSRAPKLGP